MSFKFQKNTLLLPIGNSCIAGGIFFTHIDPGFTLTSIVGENIPLSIPFGVETKFFN